MRIAVDVRSLMEGGVSGVERYTREIIRAMAQSSEHEFHLFYNSWREVQLPNFGDSVYVHGLKYPNKVFKAAQFMAGRPKWDRLLPKVDCVFMPSLGLMPLTKDVPLVLTIHDLSFEHFPEFFDVRKRVWHSLMRPRQLAQRADRIIAVSEHTKRDVVEQYGVADEKVKVIYSGVAPNPPTPRESHSVTLAGESARLPEKFILFLGTLEPRKNVGSLIRAFAAMARRIPHDLVIAGSPGWLLKDIEAAVEEIEDKQRIHFVGKVSEEEKMALYAAADLFVYPSLYEGFGFPPLEALLAGTPVVTSYNSALPEVVGEWATLVNPYDVAELALVIEELLKHPEPVSEEVKQAVREKYFWDRAARETLRVLGGVARAS